MHTHMCACTYLHACAYMYMHMHTLQRRHRTSPALPAAAEATGAGFGSRVLGAPTLQRWVLAAGQAGSSAGSSQAARRQLAGRQPRGQAARTQPVPTPPTCAGSRVPTTEPPLCRWARVCAHVCVCVHTRVPVCARLAAPPSAPKCPQLAPAPPKKMPLGPQHLPPAVAVPGPSPARRGARGGRVVIKLICTCKSSSV